MRIKAVPALVGAQPSVKSPCHRWLTDKSSGDRLPRPALKVRANRSKSSEEGCKRLATRFNGFEPMSPDFNHGRLSNEAMSLLELLSVNQLPSPKEPLPPAASVQAKDGSYFIYDPNPALIAAQK